LLREELFGLTEKYRLPILLFYFEGKTYEEAARDLHCAVGTIKSRLARGRELLRKRLTRRGMTLASSMFGPVAVAIEAPPAPAALVMATVKAAMLRASG